MSATANPPLVTLGVPVYNGEKFLAETLDCLAAQTYRHIEILIADNASTDGTAAIAQQYQRADARFRHVRHAANIGANGNVRFFAAHANGKYFKLSNADDLVTPDFVASCVDVLESDSGVALACSQADQVDLESRYLRDYDDGMHIVDDDPVARFGRVVSRVRLTNSIQGVARSELIRELFPRHGSYDGADMVILAAIAARGKIHQVPRVMFHRRMHEWSASSKDRDGQAMQQYLDPATTGKVSAYLTRILAGYVAEATRAPVGLGARAAMVGKTLRWGIAQRGALVTEWGRVMRRSLGLTPARG